MWIRTTRGKRMPVDIEEKRFYPDPQGEELYIMEDGHTMKGTPAPGGGEDLPCVASGFTSHFATCQDAEKFRKGDAAPLAAKRNKKNELVKGRCGQHSTGVKNV